MNVKLLHEAPKKLKFPPKTFFDRGTGFFLTFWRSAVSWKITVLSIKWRTGLDVVLTVCRNRFSPWRRGCRQTPFVLCCSHPTLSKTVMGSIISKKSKGQLIFSWMASVAGCPYFLALCVPNLVLSEWLLGACSHLTSFISIHCPYIEITVSVNNNVSSFSVYRCLFFFFPPGNHGRPSSSGKGM